MDGFYQNRNQRLKTKLIDWSNLLINNRGWERFEDLHLDLVDSEFKDSETWVSGAFEVYDLMLDVLKNKGFDCLLTIPLDYSVRKTKLQDISMSYIQTNLDLTPPSYYIFPKDSPKYIQSFINLPQLIALQKEVKHKVYFKEELEAPNEYFRCLYVWVA